MVVIVSCLALWMSSQAPRFETSRRWLLAAVIIFGAFAVIPLDPQLSQWRQTNVVAAQTGRLIDAASGRGDPPLTLHRTVKADLPGESTIGHAPHASNVLLILLEGVSGAYLPSLRDRHGETNSITMPRLDRIAQSGDFYCDGSVRTCAGTPLNGMSLYSPGVELSPVDPHTVGWLQRGAEESRSAGVAPVDEREFVFVQPGSTPVMEDSPGQLIFGGQFLTIPAGVQAEVEIEIGLSGPKAGALNFSHDLVIHDQQQFLRTGRLEAGQTVKI